MNVLGAILGIKVNLTGLGAVQGGIASLNTTLASAASQTHMLTNATYALAAAGLAIGLSSIPAYENLEKTRRSFQAFLGEASGAQFSTWLSNFAIEANTSTDALRKVATQWISLTGNDDKVKSLVTGIEAFGLAAGKTNAELIRTGKAISDIQNAGTFRAQERNQLANAGVPLYLVSRELGVDNINKALGMSADKVVPAILKVLNSLPKKPPLFLQGILNLFEAWQKAIAPTGRLLSMAFAPILIVGGAVISVFDKLNELTFGFAGALLSASLLVPAFATLASTFTTLVPLFAQFIGLQKIGAFWAGVWQVLNGGWIEFPKMIWKAVSALYTYLAAQITNVTWAGALAALTGNWVGLATAGVILGAGGYALYRSNRDQSERADQEKAASTPAASRGYRRSSAENWMYRTNAKLMGG